MVELFCNHEKSNKTVNQLSKVEKKIISYSHRLRSLLNYHTRILLNLGDKDVGSAGDDDNDDRGGRVMIIMLITVTYGKRTHRKLCIMYINSYKTFVMYLLCVK